MDCVPENASEQGGKDQSNCVKRDAMMESVQVRLADKYEEYVGESSEGRHYTRATPQRPYPFINPVRVDANRFRSIAGMTYSNLRIWLSLRPMDKQTRRITTSTSLPISSRPTMRPTRGFGTANLRRDVRFLFALYLLFDLCSFVHSLETSALFTCSPDSPLLYFLWAPVFRNPEILAFISGRGFPLSLVFWLRSKCPASFEYMVSVG